MMTIADVQRQNRETAQKRKRKAIRIASSFAIGLHVIAIIAGAIYFVRKTVLEMNDDKVESVVLEASKPEPKRRTPPRTTRKPKQPKFSKVRAPKGQAVTTSAKIPVGNARFTLPTSNVSTRPVMAPSTAGIGRNLFRATQQQANILQRCRIHKKSIWSTVKIRQQPVEVVHPLRIKPQIDRFTL